MTTISGDTGVDKFDGTTIAGHVIQVANYTTGTMATGTGIIPYDNTIPQITEGTQFMSLAFTPKKANSKLKIIVNAIFMASVASKLVSSIFRDSGTNAVASVVDNRIYAVGTGGIISFIAYIDAVSTSLSTFTVRGGLDRVGTITFNGEAGAGYFGGSLASSITIEEIAQ